MAITFADPFTCAIYRHKLSTSKWCVFSGNGNGPVRVSKAVLVATFDQPGTSCSETGVSQEDCETQVTSAMTHTVTFKCIGATRSPNSQKFLQRLAIILLLWTYL